MSVNNVEVPGKLLTVRDRYVIYCNCLNIRKSNGQTVKITKTKVKGEQYNVNVRRMYVDVMINSKDETLSGETIKYLERVNITYSIQSTNPFKHKMQMPVNGTSSVVLLSGVLLTNQTRLNIS